MATQNFDFFIFFNLNSGSRRAGGTGRPGQSTGYDCRSGLSGPYPGQLSYPRRG